MTQDSGGAGGVAIGSHDTGGPEKSGGAGGAQPSLQQQEQRFGKRGSGQAFALGLFQILKTEDPKVIGWSASGKAFRIGDSEKFCKEIMPRFFKQNKYSSFQRQLNLYGFRKLVRGDEAGGYMHPLFERGKPEQLSQVRRGFFPDIPPEFAHDVHGHGLNDGAVGGDSGATASNPSKAAARGGGRKSADTVRPIPSNPQGSVAANKGNPNGGGGHERSSSLGQSRMTLAATAAAAAVTAASAGVRGGGHHRTESGSSLLGRRVVEDGMSIDNGGWVMDGGGQGPLPSLDSLTGGLQNLQGGRHGNGGGGQGGGAEMPPTLGRLVPCAENVVSRESSPMKPGAGGDGGGSRMHAGSSSSDFHHRTHHRAGVGHHLPYGRSQDDLNLTPRSHYSSPIMGLGDQHAVPGNWASGGVHGGGPSSGYNNLLGRGHNNDFSMSSANAGGNGNGNPYHLSPQPLQHMHSRDDLDALRPRKTRRTGPSLEQDNNGQSDNNNQEQPRHSFLVTPRTGPPNGPVGGFLGERGGYLNTAGVYPAADELPPAAPRRLVSRHNTPSRPERSSCAKNGGGSGEGHEGDEGGKRGGPHLMTLEPTAMDTDGGGGGGSHVSQGGFQLAAHGFYAAMSPVTVAPGRVGGFSRRHHRHASGSTHQGSAGDVGGAGAAGAGAQWRVGEVSPEQAPAVLGDSPSSTRSGGGGSAAGGGVLGVGGLGLTAHAMSRMEQVKGTQRANGMSAPGAAGSPQGVQALGENLSQLDLSEHSRNELYRQQRGGGGGGAGGDADRIAQQAGGGGGQGQGQQSQQQQQQQHQQQHQQKQQQHQQRPQPNYTQPLRDAGGSDWSNVRKRQGSGGGMAAERRPTAAEAAELLRRRSSVDEVIGLLSAPSADGSFEDEGMRSQDYNPAQFDSWRNSLTKVLGHLGFDFEDEEEQQGAGGKANADPSSDKHASGRGTSQFLSWGGTSAMSFEERPEEFHESLRQIPMRWRSSLSSIMTSMASNGGFDEHGGAHADGTSNGGGGSRGAGGMDLGGDGNGTGERKRLEQQASLEMLQSVMRETLESMSTADGQESSMSMEDGEQEAKAAATAALAMGSMCRAKSNDQITNGGSERPLSAGSTGSGRAIRAGYNPYGAGGPVSSAGFHGASAGASTSAGVMIGGGQHERRSGQTEAGGYFMRQQAGGGGQYALAAGGGGGGGGGGGVGVHHDHHTTL